MWKRLYSKKTCTDRGTLYQLRNLIHRTAIKADPSKNMKATEDFVTVVLYGYIIAGATQLLKDEPAKVFTYNEIAKSLVRRWIKISRSSSTAETSLKGTDYSYAMDFMSLGLTVAWFS